jgi:hypothetical protein
MNWGTVSSHQKITQLSQQKAHSLSAFSQQLKLPLNLPQTPFITLTGSPGLRIYLSLRVSSPELSLSQPLEYIYDLEASSPSSQISEFVFDPDSSPENLDQTIGFSVYLERLRGRGSFLLSACSF